MSREAYRVLRIALVAALTSAGLMIAVGNVTAAGPALHIGAVSSIAAGDVPVLTTKPH
jgi:hypothetical protein